MARVDVAVVPATLEHAAYVAAHMRQADVDEVRAAAAIDPLSATANGLQASGGLCWAGLVNGVAVCIFGAAPAEGQPGVGHPWMLATDDLERHQMAFLRRNRPYVKLMSDKYQLLTNVVDVRNTASIRWLKWLGFEFGLPARYGPCGMMFMQFSMRGKPCASSLPLAAL